jgi:hypothetical protein
MMNVRENLKELNRFEVAVVALGIIVCILGWAFIGYVVYAVAYLS